MTERAFDVPADLFPFEHRFVGLDGADVHYIDEGRGEPILLLHGNPTWSFLYRKIVGALRDSFRCIALDYPGFGMSTGPAGYRFTAREHSAVVERFVDRLGLEDLTLMVQDWGGPIGLGFAGRRSQKVARLVVGNTWAWPHRGDRRISVFSAVMGGPLGRSASFAFNGVVRFFMRRGVVRSLAPDVYAMYLAPFRDRRSRAPVTIFPREPVSAEAYLREVELGLPALRGRPALIVWGTRDFAFGAKERERFEAAFPKHHTVLLDAGHFIQEDAGAEIARAFREWRASLG